MSKQHLQIAKMLENLVQLQKAKDRELQDNLMGAMAQMLTKSVAEKVPHIVQHELKHAVLPSLHQMVETYRLQIDTQHSQVKENFAKVLSSKVKRDSLRLNKFNSIKLIYFLALNRCRKCFYCKPDCSELGEELQRHHSTVPGAVLREGLRADVSTN